MRLTILLTLSLFSISLASGMSNHYAILVSIIDRHFDKILTHRWKHPTTSAIFAMYPTRSHYIISLSRMESPKKMYSFISKVTDSFYSWSQIPCNVIRGIHTMERLLLKNRSVICTFKYYFLKLRMENTFVAYSHDDVSLAIFLKVLLNDLPSSVSTRRRLNSNKNSTLLIFLNGHGGENFIKFQVMDFSMVNQ